MQYLLLLDLLPQFVVALWPQFLLQEDRRNSTAIQLYGLKLVMQYLLLVLLGLLLQFVSGTDYTTAVDMHT